MARRGAARATTATAAGRAAPRATGAAAVIPAADERKEGHEESDAKAAV
jgi:hypothetical protein